MNKRFSDALDHGHIQPANWPDGTPLLLGNRQLYMATDDGFNLGIQRFHAFGDTLRKHDELRLTGELLATGFDAVKLLLKRIRAQASLDIDQVLDAVGEALLVIDRLEQRQNLGLSVEQVYELASIFYFFDDEDPGGNDSTLNHAKIKLMLTDARAAELYTSTVKNLN